MRPLLEMNMDELRLAVVEAGEKPYRAEQLADWVYNKGVTDPAAMTNLPETLPGRFTIMSTRVVRRLDASDGTIKLLIECADGGRVECAMIPADRRATACVSSQIGCAMGCEFCASGKTGLQRNLAAGEILQQLLHLRQALGHRLTHVVFMGVGEPLANYEAVISAAKAIIDPLRFGISARRVTISTAGLPKMIRRLAAEKLPVTLAISLHAPNDALRRRIMPKAAFVPLSDLIEAAGEFYASRNRELTLEYVLLRGVNDTNVCAEALARIAGRLRCSVNLIRYNPIGDAPFERPSQAATRAFADRLARRGVNVQIRRPRGLDADAACGQLRRGTDQDC